jgi:hypothetical protein
MTAPDPKVVLQAHTLRTEATRQALLHGSAPARSRRGSRAMLLGLAIAAVIAVVIVVAGRVAAIVAH